MISDIIWKFNINGLEIDKEAAEKYNRFAGMIHEYNQKFNLTGHKTRDIIENDLIIGSILPLRDIIVPRGTSFIDIGTGAGIPGIPLALYHNNFNGILVDSSSKKTDFLELVKDKLIIDNISIINRRVEKAGREEAFREKFDWCFSRAFAKHYIAIELGAPFLLTGGNFFIYANADMVKIPPGVLGHAQIMGLNIMSHSDMTDHGIKTAGICFSKSAHTPDKYPRKYAAIKREAELIAGE